MSGGNDPHTLVVGHINKPHGTKGEVFVWPLTDHPESTFAPGVVLILGDDSGSGSPDDSHVPIESVRPFRRGYLVRFLGVQTRNEAEELRGRYLLRAFEDVEKRGDDELFYHELLGLTVTTREGTELGEVVEVYELRPAHLLEVKGPGRTVMIPFLEHIVSEVDLESGVLVIDPPEGLLDV